MRSNAPKVKRNETMTLSDRKHFQSFEKNPKTGHYCSKVFVQGEKKFECETCSKSYPTKSGLRNHFKNIHGKKTTCELCNQTLSNSSSIRQHRKRFHLEPKNYICDLCDKVFKTDTYLGKHVKTKHSK